MSGPEQNPRDDEPIDREAYEKWEEEQEMEECTCDITGEDGCPVHYPIDDGSDDDDCMDCGMCDSCIARTRAQFEEQERSVS